MLRRIVRATGDMVRFAAAFASDPEFRRVVQKARPDDPASPLRARESEAAPATARSHRFVDSRALALVSTTSGTGLAPVVNLVLSGLSPGARFAGVATALEVGAGLARRLGMPLRIVVLDESQTSSERDRVAAELHDLDPRPSVVSRADLGGTAFGEGDLWLVTHWTTAYAAHVAVLADRIRPERVISLVQDYEPGFVGWSVASEAATTTYRAGFTLLINSSPLARHLRAQGVETDDDLVFAPRLLDDIAPRQASAPPRVFFYGRPSKPRNLFRLGVAALDAAAAQLGPAAAGIEFVSAGEPHADVPLAGGAVLRSRGALGIAAYRDLLATSRVALSLQASPHPSHPPLEAALAGAVAITNTFGSTRDDLHPRLRPVAADVEALAGAIVDALAEPPVTASEPMVSGVLGRDLDDVLDGLAARFGRPAS